MRLMISVPHTGTLRAEIDDFVQAAKAVFRSRGWVLDYRKPHDRPTASCRNRQVHVFRETPYDYLLTMDADCTPTKADGSPDIDGLLRLLNAIQNPEVDIVAGWTLIQREDAGDMVPCVVWPPDEKGEWPVDNGRPYLQANPMQEITGGGVGTHCMMIKRRVFDGFLAAGRIWFEDIIDRDPSSPDFGCRRVGHDFMFTRTAADLGYRVWLRNDVLWGHRKDVDLRWVHDVVRGLTKRIDAHALIAKALKFLLSPGLVLRAAEEIEQLGEVVFWSTGLDWADLTNRILPSGAYWEDGPDREVNLVLVQDHEGLCFSDLPLAKRRVLIHERHDIDVARDFARADEATVERVGEGMVVRCGF